MYTVQAYHEGRGLDLDFGVDFQDVISAARAADQFADAWSSKGYEYRVHEHKGGYTYIVRFHVTETWMGKQPRSVAGFYSLKDARAKASELNSKAEGKLEYQVFFINQHGKRERV